MLKSLVFSTLMIALTGLPASNGHALEGQWTTKPDANQGGFSGPAWCFESGGQSIVVKQFGGTGITNVGGTLNAVELTVDPATFAGGIYFITRSSCTDDDFNSYGLNSETGKRLVNGCIDNASSSNAVASSGSYEIGITTSLYSAVPAGPYNNLIRWSIDLRPSDPADVTGTWTVTTHITQPSDGVCVPVPGSDGDGTGKGGSGDNGGGSIRPIDLEDYLRRAEESALPDTI